MLLNELNEQIDNLKNNVPNLVEKLTFQPSPIEVPDVEFPDDRAIMKSIIMNGETGEVLDNPKVNNKDAHLIVYGHTNTNSTEIDEENALPEDHPKMVWIKNAKKDVKVALKQLKNKGGELVSASTLLTIQVGSAVATIGSSAVVLPIGSGLPTAFNALMSIFASLESFIAKLNDILPILEKLQPLVILLIASKTNPNTIVAPIVSSLIVINSLLSTIESSVGPINSLKEKMPVPAGGLDMEGNQTDPLPIEVEIEEKNLGDGYHELTAKPSNGSWEYKSYRWNTSDPNEPIEYSNSKNIKVRPQLRNGTEYICEVTDSTNIKGSGKIRLTI